MHTLVGQQWGNYRLIRMLGRGGFAEVYLGEHVRLSMHAAIKILHTLLPDDNASAFQREAQAIADLAHPHIVRLFDFDVKDNRPFLVLEYAPAGSLGQKYPRGTVLPLPVVADYVGQIASALQYAHEKKLIHRDIKPENMLIGRQGQILLGDFGIVTAAHSTPSMYMQESMGTVSYMAPEQIQGYPRAASDQYALGVVAYQWLSGMQPFQGSSGEIVAQHLGAPPRSLRESMPHIPIEVEQVVYTALAKDPGARFSNVLAFANALKQAVEEQDVIQPAQLSGNPENVATSLPSVQTSAFSLSLTPTERLAAVRVPPVPIASPEAQVSSPDEQLTVTMSTETVSGPEREPSVTLRREQQARFVSPVPVSPAFAAQVAQHAVSVDEQQTVPGLPAIASQINPTVTPRGTVADTSARGRRKRVILLLAAVCILLLASLGLWSLLTLHTSVALKSTNGHVDTTPSELSTLTATAASMPSVTPAAPGTPLPGTNPTATSSPHSTATTSPSTTPTSEPACLNGSTSTITVTQVVGQAISLSGTAVTLTNCSSVAGHWAATSQLYNGNGWTDCNPVSGDLAANGTEVVHIVLGSSSALVGTYTAQWTFTMNGASWIVHAKLIVVL